MFDIGFLELLVIGLVALVVLGPERLPTVAKTAGALLGRARHYVNEVKSEISREVNLQEFHTLRAEVVSSAREFQDSMQREMSAIKGAITDVTNIAEIRADDGSKPEEAIPEETTPALLAQVDMGQPQENPTLAAEPSPHAVPPFLASVAAPSSSLFDQTMPVA